MVDSLKNLSLVHDMSDLAFSLNLRFLQALHSEDTAIVLSPDFTHFFKQEFLTLEHCGEASFSDNPDYVEIFQMRLQLLLFAVQSP